jgi:hypothetical protein
MTSRGNGQQKTYRVTHVGQVKEALAFHYARAKLNGEGEAFIAALEHVYNRLRLNPQNFGEPKYPLHGMKATVYVGVHKPLVVGFALHDTEPLVMIQSVQYLEKP